MGIGKFKRKLRNSKKGVSEIIANILILAITVTLFSTIMIYVAQMPSPQKNAYTDFTPSIRYLDGANQIELNLTHMGGQELVSNDTGFYIFVNDTRSALTPGQIISSVGYRWVIGETFSYRIQINPAVNPDIHKVRLSVMITDKEKNSMVYSANVVGGTATVNTPPIIGARGTTPSPTYENTSFNFYAQITDLDNDLDVNSVNIDLTSIGGGASVKMNDFNADGIFTAGPYLADIDWNGAVVIVTCSDLTGNVSSGQIMITIFRTFSTTGGGGGYPSDFPINIDMSGLQGFNIFEWNDWEENNFNGTPEREFTYGESAVVVVVSKYLVNLNQENVLLVMDQTTKNVITSVSSPANIFAKYKVNFISGYYIYNISIDTGLMPNNAYFQVQIQLRDSWVPNNIFFANDMIKVGAPSPYPVIKTYKDAAFSQESKDFNSTDTIYVEVQNKYGGTWYQYGGDVEIRDFFWNAQVKRTPPTGGPGLTAWNGPVSNVWNLAVPSNAYHFEINLQNATDGATWIPGKNAYNLRFDMFKAGSETYLLTKVINVTAPKWKTDVVVAGLLQSGGRYTSPAALFYYKNDNQWSPPDLLETSSDKSAYNPDVKLVRAGDMDQDGKSDIVAIRYTTNPTTGYFLSWYKNLGTGWAKYSIATLAKMPTMMAIGNIDLDNDLDVVVGYGGGDLNNAVWLYRNDGTWSSLKIGEYAGKDNGVTALEIADMDAVGTTGNDANRSLDVIAGRANGIVTVYKNAVGTGTSWNPSSVSGATADIFNFADSDIDISGTVIGTYQNTTNSYQDDGVYQLITEELIQEHKKSYPTSKGLNDTVDTDLISDIQYEDDTPYTVNFGKTAEVKLWDATGLYDIYTNYTVTFNVLVRTTNYSGGDYIRWWSQSGMTWTSHNILQVSDTGGDYQFLQKDITNDVKVLLGNKPTNLQYLLTSFTNSIVNSYVDFDYWSINITYTLGDQLEHVWTIDVRNGLSHTFEVYGLRSALVDGDALRFAYSIDNVSFTDMVTVTDTVLPMDKYSYVMPAAINGVIYIKVYDSVRSLPNPTLDWIRVGQMSVRTLAPVSTIGVQVLALDVADINKDGSNDLLVVTKDSTNKGSIYVGLNSGGDVLTSLNQVVTASTKYNGVSSAQAGKFFDSPSKARLDIMVSTGSTVYVLRWNGGPFYVEDYSVFSHTDIVKSMAQDIDSNGRTDLVVVTETQIWLYANYQGTSTGWQKYLVDDITGMTVIQDCDIGRLQTG